jgi:TonB family protein
VAQLVSAFSLRSDRLSPSGLALAALLHATAALALWWMSRNPPQLPPGEDPIAVTFEQPKAPDPPPMPPPSRPVIPALPPPAPLTSEKPTQVPPKGEQSKEAHAAPSPSLEQTVPAPPPEPLPPPSFERPKLAAPAQPRHQQESLAPPVQPSLTPQTPPQRQLRPSPLTTPRQQPPRDVARTEEPSPSPLVNPADVYNRARVADNYLWQIVRKLVGYRYHAAVNVQEGTTVVRVVIARDGRLLDIQVAQSSGFPLLDNGVVAGVRAGSPYEPLPPDIHGDRATFTLPLVSVHR